MSFGNFIFFAAHFVCLLGVSRKEDLRRHLHTGLLPLQLLVWMGTLVAMFAIPSYVFDTYGQVREACMQDLHEPSPHQASATATDEMPHEARSGPVSESRCAGAC